MTNIKAVLKILRLIHVQGFSEKLVFRINDAADLLEIPYQTMEEECLENRIDTKKFGTNRNMWRITAKALADYLEELQHIAERTQPEDKS